MPPSLPSTLAPKLPKIVRPVLIVHTAVSYVKGEGVGIGVVQRAESSIPGVRFTQNDVLPIQERAYSIRRESITINSVETSKRAHMLAISNALRLVKRTVKAPRENVQLEKVTVFSGSENTVSLVNRHTKNIPESLDDIRRLNDRKMIKKVVHQLGKLERYGIEVDISFRAMATPTAHRAGTRAMIMAKQKGRQSCRDRRNTRLARGKMAIDTRGDRAAVGRTLELPIRTRPQ
jgi:hypothetical protein